MKRLQTFTFLLTQLQTLETEVLKYSRGKTVFTLAFLEAEHEHSDRQSLLGGL